LRVIRTIHVRYLGRFTSDEQPFGIDFPAAKSRRSSGQFDWKVAVYIEEGAEEYSGADFEIRHVWLWSYRHRNHKILFYAKINVIAQAPKSSHSYRSMSLYILLAV
jgi:hypothetical protein